MKKTLVFAFYLVLNTSVLADDSSPIQMGVPHSPFPLIPLPPHMIPPHVRHDTAMMAAVKKGNVDDVKNLLAEGSEANPKGVPILGFNTFLIQAVLDGNIEIVKILLDAGADVNATPEIEIKLENPLPPPKIMIEKQVPMTAFMIAAQEKHVEVVKILLEAGANPNVTDNNGKTIRDYVMKETPEERATQTLKKMVMQKETTSEEIEQIREKIKIYEEEMAQKRDEIIILLEKALNSPKEKEPES